MLQGTLRKIRARTESWSSLAEKQIIAQGTIRPIVSEGGYDPRGTKQAVVWTNDRKFSGTFELIDVEVYKAVYRGTLKDSGRHVWGGNNLLADFTAFTMPGRYRMRLHLEGTNEVVDSVTFPIRPSLYVELAEQGARWYYYQRCGVEIPGWHPACHTDDALLDGKPYDATGGWHDGGDYNKWSHYSYYGLFALCALYDAFPERWKGERELAVPLEEAVWEAEYVCKVQREDGTLLSAIGADEDDPWLWEGVPEKEPTRRLSPHYGGESYSNTTLVGASMARLANVLKSIGYEEAAISRYTKVAQRAYNRACEMDFSRIGPRPAELPLGHSFPSKTEYLETQAGLLLMDLELLRLTGDDRYRADIEQRARMILSAQDERGFFYTDPERSTPCYGLRYFPLFALYELWKMDQGAAPSLRSRRTCFKEEIAEAFGKWVSFFEPLTRLSPFGQMGGPDREGHPRNLPPGAGNIHMASAGWAMAAAAKILKRKELLEIAERQLHWIVGYNPAEVSTMAGVGQGPGAYHTRLVFCEGHEDGVIPGGILNGIRGGDGTSNVNLGDPRTGNPVVPDHLPVDYPIIDTDVYGWTYAYMPNEYWVPNNGWFVLAAVQVEKAISRFD